MKVQHLMGSPWGPPGARPDGLHREPGVLRGVGARAPLRFAARGEPPGPRAGREQGAPGLGPRREAAAAPPARGPRGPQDPPLQGENLQEGETLWHLPPGHHPGGLHLQSLQLLLSSEMPGQGGCSSVWK
ncbi:collagen alpha-1(I) chain-like [Octodon degus]|uniref:Collagen alpha-1(I) chain-like n=1 Tax=Octodon degus TaxID=10160 RepID=A0A6P6DAR4_OCTDE|nr:collagen alpha-1(I) chain-like [Octodon degus]